jgi:EAL domain-containing protein (putative c-di-GMP-specific phosphodiesterase class I)
MKIATELRGAVERGQIEAWFQPQVDIASGRIVAAEALCRWHHPEFGDIPPAVFIPVAEEVGLIEEIGRYMVEASCAAAARWGSRQHPVDVSVNVSPTQLVATQLTERLASVVKELKLPPRALTIEITESLPLVETPELLNRLDELRELGLGISLDDFGTGHASLAQLDALPATELKIDQSLVQDPSTETHALLAAVVGIVHDAGLRVVAEGVETVEQLERVRELGCDRVQGYLVGTPMPQHELEALLP